MNNLNKNLTKTSLKKCKIEKKIIKIVKNETT